jgi:dUTP pyrophosphatase
MVLNREEIERLIREKNLIEGYISLKHQSAPNGFDLTAGEIFAFDMQGALDFSNKERIIPEGKKIKLSKRNPEDKFGWWKLKRGAYKIVTNEVCNFPRDLIGLGFSRSSLLRIGAFTQHGVWDAGFHGKSEFILVVENPKGLRLKQNARLAQLIFLRINETKKGYNGIHQGK